jgi:hypothetical protein
VAERKARLDTGLVVAAIPDQQPFGVLQQALLRHRVQDGAVGLGRGDGDRQAAAGLGPSEQDIGQRVAHRLPGQPAAADRRDLVRPRHQYRHARVHYHDRAVVHLGDPPD